METPLAYIPMDRRQALAWGRSLPERTQGAALFADISGFTPLTESLAIELGAQRGAEELTVHLNRVYEALIAEVHRYRGSVVGFSGDAITCWLDGDDGRRAAAAALAMQRAMRRFAAIQTQGGRTVSLAMKAAVAAGPVRRFLAGDPGYCVVDVLAGATLERLAAAEHQAERGEVVLDGATAAQLASVLDVKTWRPEASGAARCAVLAGLRVVVPEDPWPALPAPYAEGAIPGDEAQVRPWLLPRVYERLARGQGEFLAELRLAVALFLRFGGIDYDGDVGAPAKLNQFIQQVQAVLLRYDGSLIQLTVGDKGSYLYAAFGAPLAHEDDAARAAATALELQALATGLPYLTPLQIGITQGRMRTGAYGSAACRTYGVLGDAVNLAARLMESAEPGQILATALVRQAAGEAFAWEPRPAVHVKGKREPVAVAGLLGRPDRAAALPMEPRYALPMVGREPELALIGARRRQAAAGHGQIVGLAGEAGIGKSRLAAEAARLAQMQGFTGYGGECHSYGANTRYLVWQPIWRGLFGLSTNMPPEQQVALVTDTLNRMNPALLPRLPLLGAVLSLPIADNALTEGFDAKLRKTSLEALLVDCLRAFARDRPLLLILEDCHWLDPLSRDLVVELGRALGDLPVVMLLTYRPAGGHAAGPVPGLRGLAHFTELTLGEFSAPEAERLVTLKLGQVLGDATSAPPEFVQRVIERAAGNPFFIEELLNFLRDRSLVPSDRAALAALELPPSLETLILSRIDQLGESEKATLRVASVIGRVFNPAMVWGIYPEAGSLRQVETDLQLLSQLDLTPIDTPYPEPAYLFKHGITQQVAYESLLYATRARLHEQTAEFIEANYPDAPRRYVDLLAYHYDHSANVAKKREYLMRAGEAAQAAYANAAALDYYQRARPLLAAGEQGPLLLKLGQVLELVGQWEEAAAADREALGLAEQLRDQAAQAQAQRSLGWLLRKRGDYGAAMTWLEQAWATYDALGDAAGSSGAVADMGEVYRLQAKYTEARRCYAASLELAEQVGDPRQRRAARAQALKGAGTVAMWQGDYTTSRTFGEESLAIRRQLGSQVDIATMLNNLGILALFQRDLPQARRMYEESLTLFRQMGDLWAMGQVLNNLGLVTGEQGDPATAQDVLEESLAIRRQLGDRAGLALSLNTLADVMLDQGRYQAARPLLEESLATNCELGDQTAIAYLLEDFGGLAAADGHAEWALRLAGCAAALRAALGAPLPPAEQARLDRLLEPARGALGQGAAAAAWAEGQALPLAEAIAYALSTRGQA